MNFHHMIAKIESIVTKDYCNELAIKTGFVKRSSSRFHGDEFFKLLVLPTSNLESENLNNLTLRLRNINPAADISASALCQRLNKPEAVEFMKACFVRCLSVLKNKNDFFS